MLNAEFDVFSTKSIKLSFFCPKCETEINEVLDDIPSPNLLSEKDTHYGTMNSSCTTIECPICSKQFTVDLIASCCGGEIYSKEIGDDAKISFDYIENEYFDDYSDAIESNSNYFETFVSQMDNIKKLTEVSYKDPDVNNTFYKIIFGNIITCMETYLSDALINSVTTNDILLKRFVNSFEDYKNKSIKYNSIIELYEGIHDQVKKDLFGLMYHNIPKISQIYKFTFGIAFNHDLIKEIMKKVSIRHDIVHRNGKDDKGNIIVIKEEDITETFSLIYDFIHDIDDKLTDVLETLN